MEDHAKVAERMMRQAPMTVHDWMLDAIERIDKICGEGYALDHPELLGDFLKACGSDQVAMAILHHSSGLEDISDNLYQVADNLNRDVE